MTDVEQLAREIWKQHTPSHECLRLEYADGVWFAGFVGSDDRLRSPDMPGDALAEASTLADVLGDLLSQLTTDQDFICGQCSGDSMKPERAMKCAKCGLGYRQRIMRYGRLRVGALKPSV
jgi:hypothetical protein